MNSNNIVNTSSTSNGSNGNNKLFQFNYTEPTGCRRICGQKEIKVEYREGSMEFMNSTSTDLNRVPMNPHFAKLQASKVEAQLKAEELAQKRAREQAEAVNKVRNNVVDSIQKEGSSSKTKSSVAPVSSTTTTVTSTGTIPVAPAVVNKTTKTAAAAVPAAPVQVSEKTATVKLAPTTTATATTTTSAPQAARAAPASDDSLVAAAVEALMKDLAVQAKHEEVKKTAAQAAVASSKPSVPAEKLAVQELSSIEQLRSRSQAPKAAVKAIVTEATSSVATEPIGVPQPVVENRFVLVADPLEEQKQKELLSRMASFNQETYLGLRSTDFERSICKLRESLQIENASRLIEQDPSLFDAIVSLIVALANIQRHLDVHQSFDDSFLALVHPIWFTLRTLTTDKDSDAEKSEWTEFRKQCDELLNYESGFKHWETEISQLFAQMQV